jgi:hypothetical protein
VGKLHRPQASPSYGRHLGCASADPFREGRSHAALVRKAPRAPAAGVLVGTSFLPPSVEDSLPGCSSRQDHELVTGGVRAGITWGRAPRDLLVKPARTRRRGYGLLGPWVFASRPTLRPQGARLPREHTLLGGNLRRGVRGCRPSRGRARKPCRLQKSTGGIRINALHHEVTALRCSEFELPPTKVGDGSKETGSRLAVAKP